MRFLFLLLLVLHCFPFAVSSADTISQNRLLLNGKTVVSRGQVFELGFFRPNETNAWYVGIWWKKFPDSKVVWVANRENPLTDSSGALMIGADGNLIITDGKNNIIWSTKVAGLQTNQTVATLSDAGNLVLKEEKAKGLVFWESFNHPSDTFLPGMKIGVNIKTGEQISLNSWEHEKNPSPGTYVSQVDPQELLEIVITKASVKYFRTGQWNGMSFVGIPRMNKDYRSGFRLLVDSQAGSYYFTSSLFNISPPSFIYLNSSGSFIRKMWDVEKMQWIKIELYPVSPCNLFSKCGPFGQCQFAGSLVCNCLIGYEPKFSHEWNKRNWKDGCVRRAKYQCETNTSSAEGEGDWFLMLTGLRLPENALYLYAPDTTRCEALCLRSCSCLAYAYVDGTGCMIWEKDLVDIEKFNYGGEQLYVRLAHSELGTYPYFSTVSSSGGKNMQSGDTVVIPIIIFATLCLGIITIFFYRRRTQNTVLMKEFKGNILSNKNSRIVAVDAVSPAWHLSVNGFRQGGSSEPLSFSFQQIEDATGKFSPSSKIGEGGFGPVYKGKLSDGQEIAVKRLSSSSGQGLQEFKNEVMLISKLQHRNLVRILGYSVHNKEKLLVYDYMPNSSLDFLTFGPGSGSKDKATLSWGQRCDIVEGIARGLVYLHRDSRLKIIHRDLKASNILLDEEMRPRISDFGMARIFCGNQLTANTNRIVGTYGYMSPEYAIHGIFSEKSDVFSYGVLLLEIVSGKRSTCIHHIGDSTYLLGYAWQLWNEGKALELIDPRLATSCNSTQVIRCINIGLLCVQEAADDRPTMAAVVLMLCNDTTLKSPKPPAFFHIKDRRRKKYLALPDKITCSRNNISETTIIGR